LKAKSASTSSDHAYKEAMKKGKKLTVTIYISEKHSFKLLIKEIREIAKIIFSCYKILSYLLVRINFH